MIAAAVATTVIYSDHEQQQREQLEEELAQENTPEEAGLVAATESTEQTAQASAVIPPEQTAETEKLEQKAAETTESTEVAQVEKEAENETAETGAGVNAFILIGGRHALADGGKCDLKLQHGFYHILCDAGPVQIQSAVIIAERSTIRYIPSQREKSSVSPTTRRLAVR